jgi:hypothetical protein
LLIKELKKLLFPTKKEQAYKHTRKERTKITKENSTGTKHRWKHAECDHVKKAEKKQRSIMLQAYENKIFYTLEDGHVGRNM